MPSVSGLRVQLRSFELGFSLSWLRQAAPCNCFRSPARRSFVFGICEGARSCDPSRTGRVTPLELGDTAHPFGVAPAARNSVHPPRVLTRCMNMRVLGLSQMTRLGQPAVTSMKTRKCIIGLILLALCAIGSARAQLIIGPSVTASAGMFHYSYSVTNATDTDVAIVTLGGLFRANNTVQNLMSPAGFGALFDPGLSLLSFFEDTQTFTAGTTSGLFAFDSSYAPGTGTYEAVNIAGNLLVGSMLVPSSAVPEPSTTAAIGGLLLIGLVLHRKFYPSKKCA